MRFVRFRMTGSFFAEERTEPVESVDPYAIAWPKDAFAFSFQERDDVVGDDGQVFTGKVRDLGPTYFHPESSVRTLAETEADPRATRILLDNMRCNRWDRIVWSRRGNYPQPFSPERHVVLELRL